MHIFMIALSTRFKLAFDIVSHLLRLARLIKLAPLF